MKSFSQAKFSFSDQMFHSRKFSNKINKVKELCPQTVYSESTSSSDELLETDNSVLVHHGNI